MMTACAPLMIPICGSPAPLGGEIVLDPGLLLADGVVDGGGTSRRLKNRQSLCRKCRKFIPLQGYVLFYFYKEWGNHHQQSGDLELEFTVIYRDSSHMCSALVASLGKRIEYGPTGEQEQFKFRSG